MTDTQGAVVPPGQAINQSDYPLMLDGNYSAKTDGDRDDDYLMWPDSSGDAGIRYPMEDYSELPGYVPIGHSVTTSDSYLGDWHQGNVEAQSYALASGDYAPNPEIGGMPGLVQNSPYSTAGVESNVVENFELTGRIVKVRRPAQTGAGPVGYSDWGGYLAQALAQDAYAYPGDDQLQSQILTAV